MLCYIVFRKNKLNKKKVGESMFDYRKLDGKITEVYKTQYKFAEALGISKASISAKLNNKTDFTQKEICDSLRLLKIPESEVYSYFFKIKV